MRVTRVTASQFQQAFGALSDKARHEPVVITKHGRDSLVVMSAEEWQRLRRHSRQVGFTTELSDEWTEAVRDANAPQEFAAFDYDQAFAELQELRKHMPSLTLDEILSARHAGHKV